MMGRHYWTLSAVGGNLFIAASLARYPGEGSKLVGCIQAGKQAVPLVSLQTHQILYQTKSQILFLSFVEYKQ